MKLKLFNMSDIRSWSPCYNPSRHLPEGWTGTIVDWLKHPTIPDNDKIWLFRRYSVMTAKGLRLFAVDCARRAQSYPKNYTPDPRTLAAIQAVEDFTHDRIGARVLAERRQDAYAAAGAAADDDAADAAYTAYAAADDDAAAAAAGAADVAYAAGAAYAAAAAAAAAYAAAYAMRKQERQAQFDYLLRAIAEHPEHFVLEPVTEESK